jgi:hypothetical protein
MRISHALLALALFAGCKEEVYVTVECVTTAAPAVECELKQTKGKTEVDVCWDWNATCENGTKVTAQRTCQKVKDGGTAKATIPADKLTNLDKCQGKPTAKVENLTLNGKASTK